MAFEGIILFISIGWFLSTVVIILMYRRIQQQMKELASIKKMVNISIKDVNDLELAVNHFKKG